MTKKPHNLKRLAAASKQTHIAGLGIIGVPGLRNATAMAAQAQMDAARATLWAHHYGLNLQNLRRLTLDELARHINRNTAWGAIEIPSYVLATIAAMQPTEPPAKPMQRKGSNVHGFILDEVKRLDPNKWEVANGPDGPMIFETDHIPPLPDELTKITPNRYAGIRYQDGKRIDRRCTCISVPHEFDPDCPEHRPEVQHG